MPDDDVPVYVPGQKDPIYFPAGTPDAVITRVLRQEQFKAQKQQPSMFDRAVDELPAAGGLVGGIVGGIGGTVGGVGVGGVPGAIAGATLGGATGEAARQLIQRARGQAAPGTMGEAAGQIGKEGAVQGALEAAGGVVAGGAKMAGHAMMHAAIDPAISTTREFGDVAATAIKERLPVGRAAAWMKKGSEQAAAKLAEQGQALRARLELFGLAGVTFDTAKTIAKPVTDLLAEIEKQPLGDGAKEQVANMVAETLSRHPGPLTPLALKELKSGAQDAARSLYRAGEKGFYVPPVEMVRAQFNRAAATGAKDALETLPGVGVQEARSQSLIGATKAISQAEARKLSLKAESISGALGLASGLLSKNEQTGRRDSMLTAAGGWLVARSLASPRTLSRGALTLTKPQLLALFKQFPRLAAAVIDEASKGESE